jgi:hypothetical protein
VNELYALINGPIVFVVNHVEMDVVYRVYTLILKLFMYKAFIVMAKARTSGNDMRIREIVISRMSVSEYYQSLCQRIKFKESKYGEYFYIMSA